MVTKLATWLAYEVLPPYINNKFPDLEVGDVLLVAGRSRLSGIIQFFTGSRWTHLAIYVGDGYVMEAFIHTGVIKTELSSFTNQEIIILRHKEIYYGINKDIKQSSILNTLNKWYGKPYDGWHLFGLAAYTLIKRWLPFLANFVRNKVVCRRNRIICSRLITHAYYRAGIPFRLQYNETMLPHQFADHEDMIKIFQSEMNYVN